MAIIRVVDDHAIDRAFLVILLEYYEHHMLEAGDGTETLEMARVERPNLIISDIFMPTRDGYEFVRQLRADPSIANTAIIFYTANYHQREGLAIAQACGVSHLLVKPCNPADFLRTVETVLHDAISSKTPPTICSRSSTGVWLFPRLK
jgi:two-component system cell cycle sensor histidine kinase/response regulator CckA